MRAGLYSCLVCSVLGPGFVKLEMDEVAAKDVGGWWYLVGKVRREGMQG